eukprot:1562342-Amphidinium_carterae.1
MLVPSGLTKRLAMKSHTVCAYTKKHVDVIGFGYRTREPSLPLGLWVPSCKGKRLTKSACDKRQRLHDTTSATPTPSMTHLTTT